MLFFLYLISRVSFMNRFPPQISQVTYTVGKKCISTAMVPLPSHASQRPPPRACGTLKENLLAFHPRARASAVSAKSSRTNVNAPVYVAGLLRGVRPIGLWSMRMARFKCSAPSKRDALNVLFERYRLSKRARKFSCNISYKNVDFPEPDTPVTATIRPSGTSTFRFLMLKHAPPRIFRALFSLSRHSGGTGIDFTPR